VLLLLIGRPLTVYWSLYGIKLPLSLLKCLNWPLYYTLQMLLLILVLVPLHPPLTLTLLLLLTLITLLRTLLFLM